MIALVAHLPLLSKFSDRSKQVTLPQFLGSPCYFHFLCEFLQCTTFNNLFLLSFKQDLSFWQNTLEASPVSKQTKNITLTSPESMSGFKQQLEPKSMYFRNQYGLWNLNGLLDFMKLNDQVSKIVIINIHSFWFLRSKDLNQIYDHVEEHEFQYGWNQKQDLIIGLDAKLTKASIKAVEKGRKDQERTFYKNLDNLLYVELGDKSRRFNRIREQRRQLNIQSAIKETKDYLLNGQEYFSKKLKNLMEDIRLSTPSISVESERDRKVLEKYSYDCEKGHLFQIDEYLKKSSSLMMMVDLNEDTLDDSSMIRLFEFGQDSPFWYIRFKCSMETLSIFVRQLKSFCPRANLYIEFFHLIDFNQIQSILKYIQAIVLNVDLESDNIRTSSEIDSWLFDLFDSHSEIMDKTIFLKTKLTSQNQQQVFLLHCKWLASVGGIVVEEENSDISQNSKTKCYWTRQIAFGSPKTGLSLCPYIQSERNLALAGKMKECEKCDIKKGFGLSSLPSIPPKLRSSHSMLNLNIDYLDSRINEQYWNKSWGSFFEDVNRMLKVNPIEGKVDQLLKQVEEEAI